MGIRLNVYESVATGSSLIGHFDAAAVGWSRSVRLMGGFWQGSLTLTGDPGQLAEIFYHWLGFHVEEQAGAARTWEGLIYELELEHKGIRRLRSLDFLANAVDVDYQTAGAVAAAGFSTNSASIGRYGRKEERLTFDAAPLATAQALRLRYRQLHDWVYPRAVSVGAGEQTVLQIRCCGYVFTGNWLFALAGDGAEHDVDHWISAVVGTAEGLSSDHGGSTSGAGDCQFLSAGNLASNTLQVKEEAESDIRAWSLIEELAGLGDSSGDPWRAWVGLDRKLHYAEFDVTPLYYLRGGRVFDSAGGQMEVNPWAMRPGVVRDMAYSMAHQNRGNVLEDARDILVEEIEVSADGAIKMKTASIDESEIMAAQEELRR